MMKTISIYKKPLGFVIAKLMLVLIFVLSSNANLITAQSSLIHLHFKRAKAKKIDMRFDLIHNLIIIPAFINGSDTLKFILDTGVSHTMITSLKGSRGTSFNYAREIELFGLGSGREVKAFHSFGNVIELPGIIGFNHNVIILKEDFDYLSQGLGTQIHGLLGYDVFSSFIVEINYKAKKLTLYDPKYYKSRKRQKLLKKADIIKMEIIRRKPYISATVYNDDREGSDVNLLVDTGASHAVSIFRSTNDKLKVPDKSLYSYLGIGLSGDIFGYIGRANKIAIGNFKFKKPIVTYPDEESVQITSYENDRNGSLGADILNRFTVVFDYHGKEMILKPNSNYKDEFKYNLSGIDVTTPMPDISIFQISMVRKGSPAWIAGLEKGDQIIMINGIETNEFTLSNIIQMLQSRAGRQLTVGIRRANQTFSAKFTLQDPIK
ncbi:MAG: aspartyl protease family protein [Cyclobacteriaceae bacterium]|nr:aspartyl protease family protein [Cyclobacteriaceae bacterium]